MRLHWACDPGGWEAARKALDLGLEGVDPFFDLLNGPFWFEEGGARVVPRRLAAEVEERWQLYDVVGGRGEYSTTFQIGLTVPMAELAFHLARNSRWWGTAPGPRWWRTEGPQELGFVWEFVGSRWQYGYSFSVARGSWDCLIRSSLPLDQGWGLFVDVRDLFDATEVFLREFHEAVTMHAPGLLGTAWFDELAVWAEARGL